MNDPVLRAESLLFDYGSDPILDIPQFSVSAHEVVAIMGASGAGKSTLLHSLAGMLKPKSGQIWFGDLDLCTLPHARRDRIRLEHFGFVTQFGDMLTELTVRENIELPCMFMVDPPAMISVDALSRRLGIEEVLDRRTWEISGGQLQRAAIARAVRHGPSVIFADEPTGALDDRNAESVVELLLELADETRAAVVIATHDRGVAARAQRLLQLTGSGGLAEQSPT